jgi:hypothetical protein
VPGSPCTLGLRQHAVGIDLALEALPPGALLLGGKHPDVSVDGSADTGSAGVRRIAAADLVAALPHQQDHGPLRADGVG